MIEVAKVTAKHGLHLRKGPKATSEILATLPFDTEVNVRGREGNWILTSYNFKDGYLYRDYVSVSKKPAPDLDLPYDALTGGPSWVGTTLALVAVIFLAIVAFIYGRS